MDSEHEHEHEHADVDAGTGVDGAERDRERETELLRRHAIAQVRQYPDVALRMRAREVTEFDGLLVQLAERMQLLMADAQGVGLAATQLGVLQRLFVFRPGEEGTVQAVVNPVLTVTGDETQVDEEGCLSLADVRVPVERPTKVTIEGKDPSGGDVRLELEGFAARVVQHEADHLDGVLIIDRTDADSRRTALGVLRPQPVLSQ